MAICGRPVRNATALLNPVVDPPPSDTRQSGDASLTRSSTRSVTSTGVCMTASVDRPTARSPNTSRSFAAAVFAWCGSDRAKARLQPSRLSSSATRASVPCPKTTRPCSGVYSNASIPSSRSRLRVGRHGRLEEHDATFRLQHLRQRCFVFLAVWLAQMRHQKVLAAADPGFIEDDHVWVVHVLVDRCAHEVGLLGDSLADRKQHLPKMLARFRLDGQKYQQHGGLRGGR